jgi:4-amino-4-deoxy-L-arabinose transferase-like glycosyltransferase
MSGLTGGKGVGRGKQTLWIALTVLILVGSVFRVGMIMFVPGGEQASWPVGWGIKSEVGGDGFFYLVAGQTLADGYGFTKPFLPTRPPYAQQMPLWTILVGTGLFLGLHSAEALKLAFVGFGAAVMLLVGIAGRRIFSVRAGLIAAGLCAFDPGLWLYERNLNAETVLFPLVALVLLLTYRYWEEPSLGGAALVGAAIGAATLTRAEQILLVPLLLAPLLLCTPSLSWPRRAGRCGLAVAVIVVLLFPWAFYNRDRFANPVLLSNGLGYTMRAGASNTTFNGELLGSFDVVSVAFTPAARIQDETVRDIRMRREAVTITRENLSRLPVVLLAREGRSFGFYAPGQHVEANGQLLNSPAAVLWMWNVLYWILLPFSVAGFVVLRRKRIPIYPLLAFFVIVIISSAITFGDPRYRACTEVPVLLTAAVAADVEESSRPVDRVLR